MDPKNPFLPYTWPDQPKEPAQPQPPAPAHGRVEPASDWELRSQPPPPRADALDLMSRRLSGTLVEPETPSSVAPELEGEGLLADPEQGSRPPPA